jgi:hypothetical protein
MNEKLHKHFVHLYMNFLQQIDIYEQLVAK